ncbi:MAG: hypothetical protein O3B86_17125 [Planctomycetota bacterium]|nr:hypothetical protein [Planctomycetota bacterium]
MPPLRGSASERVTRGAASEAYAATSETRPATGGVFLRPHARQESLPKPQVIQKEPPASHRSHEAERLKAIAAVVQDLAVAEAYVRAMKVV